MSILIKGKDFGPTEQVTSTKLDELVDNASFTNTSQNSVAYTGTTGTCLQGGGLEVTSLGQLQIADSGVNTSEISDSAVTTAKIASSAVTTDKIANLNVTMGKIANLSVNSGKLADDAVTQAKIANDAVGADQLASNAVVTASIVDSNVTTDKIADSNVTTDKIADSNVTTAKIADANVTTSKIADTSITTGKIADSSVTTNKIANLNVTTAKIDNDAITTAKIADDVELGGNPTTTTQAAADNSTRIATTAYVTSGIANALTGSGGIFGTIDSTADSNPKIFSKNSSGDYDSVAPSGDVSMTQAGAFTIQANAVEGTMLNSNTVDDSSIELSSNTLSIKDNGVTTAKIADDAITTAEIADNIELGGNPTTTTQTAGNNSTRIATTAYADTAAESTGVKVATFGLADGSTSSDITIQLTEQADPNNIATVSSGVISIGAGTYLIKFYGYYELGQGRFDIDYKINGSIVADNTVSGGNSPRFSFIFDYIHVNASGTDTVQIDLDETSDFSNVSFENVGVTIMKLGS